MQGRALLQEHSLSRVSRAVPSTCPAVRQCPASRYELQTTQTPGSKAEIEHLSQPLSCAALQIPSDIDVPPLPSQPNPRGICARGQAGTESVLQLLSHGHKSTFCLKKNSNFSVAGAESQRAEQKGCELQAGGDAEGLRAPGPAQTLKGCEPWAQPRG